MMYPTEIEKLLLISPIGMPEKPTDYTSQHFIDKFDSRTSKLGAKIVYEMWIRNYTPFHVLRWGG